MELYGNFAKENTSERYVYYVNEYYDIMMNQLCYILCVYFIADQKSIDTKTPESTVYNNPIFVEKV